jgi:acyl-CoA thioesterase
LSEHLFDRALNFRGSDGTYIVEADDRWEAQPGFVFGGFLMAVVVRAAGFVAGLSEPSRPLSMACQFLRPAMVAVQLEATVASMRRGRTNELLGVTVRQGGKPLVEAQVRAAVGGAGPVFEPAQRPARVDPTSFPLLIETLRADGVEPPKIFDQIEARAAGPSEGCDLAGWWRLGPGIAYDDPWLEAAWLAMCLDSGGAAVVSRLVGPESSRQELPWAFSNLDGLVHFHEPCGSDWIHIRTRVLIASGGYASAQTQTWSVDDKLLATAITQLGFFDMSAGRSVYRNSP